MPFGRLGPDVARHENRRTDVARSRYVQGTSDRVVQGLGTIGSHDAGGTQHGKPADDTQPRIERLLGRRPAAGNGNLDAHGPVGHFGDGVGNHPSRDRIDGRLARRNLQPRFGDRADPFAGQERDLVSFNKPQRHDHVHAVGHVRVVARVFPHGRHTTLSAFSGVEHGHRDARTVGQPHVDLLGPFQPAQYARGRLGRGGGTRAGR